MGRAGDFTRGVKPVVGKAFCAGIVFGLIELAVLLRAWAIKPDETLTVFLYNLSISQYFLLFFYALLFAVVSLAPAVFFGIWAVLKGEGLSRKRVFIFLSALPSGLLLGIVLSIFLHGRFGVTSLPRGRTFWLYLAVIAVAWIVLTWLAGAVFKDRGVVRRRLIRPLLLVMFILWLASICLLYLWHENVERPYADEKASLAGDRPNIILLTIDTLRPDHLGCYGNRAVSSPNIDGLAASGYLFREAVTVVPLTLPSHSSILTGIYPDRHGVRLNSQALPEGNVTLAEILSDHGYVTAGFISVKILGTDYGMQQGFHYFNSMMGGRVNFFYLQRRSFLFDWFVRTLLEPPDILTRPADKTTRAVLRWLGDNEKTPFFLWIHYYDPHLPLDPPEAIGDLYRQSGGEGEKTYHVLIDTNRTGELKVDLRLYDGEITFVDQQLGRIFSLLEEKGIMDDTLIVFTSDHGEHLTEHDYYGHALRLFEPSLRIPLIIKPAAPLPARKEISTMVQSVDILPTILEFVSLPAPPGLNGRSLAGVMENPEPDDRAFSYGETRHTGKKIDFCYSIRTEKWKYILWPDKDFAELYDLILDPGELTNLVEARPELAKLFRSRLEAMLAAQEETDASTDVEMDDETREMLESLGYL